MNNLKLIKKNMIVAVAMLISAAAVAQEEPTFTISGSIDTYFRTNLSGGTNDPGGDLYDGNGYTSASGGTLAPSSSFANGAGFSLGMANLVMGYEGEKAGFVVDLVFGPRGADAVFASGPALNIVNQLYAYYNVTDNFKLTLGNFNTFLGYEVISPTANFNYSTSYMFSYGPFSHTGLKADFTLSDKWSLAVAVMNPTDYTDFNPSNKYVGGLQIGYSTRCRQCLLERLVK